MADDVVLGEGVAGCTMSAVTIFNFEQLRDKWKTINIFIHIFKILCVCLSVCGVCSDVCGCPQRPEALDLNGLVVVGNLTRMLHTQVLWQRAITPVPSLLLNHIG